jgi:hypothetical protein
MPIADHWWGRFLTNYSCLLQVIGVAALACGLIAVGSSNGTVTSAIAQTLMERNEASSADLKDPFARFLALGLGLSFLGVCLCVFSFIYFYIIFLAIVLWHDIYSCVQLLIPMHCSDKHRIRW